MAERDLQDLKEEVRRRCDIVDVISGYVRLTQSGQRWKGLCPFHADTTPSFWVSPAFQSYRCWACNAKGDVFTFIEQKENLPFMEALELLAKRAGIPFERKGFNPELASLRQRMLELNSLAVQYYLERCAQSTDAREYLTRRGIFKTTQDRFDIGFAPPDWEGLTSYLQRKRQDLELAATIGLIRKKRDSDGYIDYYRNRLMFPIHDLNGSIIGFGGRAMGDETPKYLNSPQSDIFYKSRTLYGLYFARETLRGDTPPVFVEGYMDVVTTHQAGFKQCVATLGTAMTEEHARTLVNYNRKVILCYDADSAGINAALKGAEIWEQTHVEGAEVRVARLPAGDDPDSLLKRGDTAAFQLALDNAIPRLDFQIELVQKRHDLTTETGRDLALKEIIPILATIRSQATLDRYVEKVERLYPANHFHFTRVHDNILADVRTYLQQTKNGASGRARGHSDIQEQNGGPLNESPPPPHYVPPSPDRWPQGFQPNTTYVVPARNREGYGGQGNWKRRNERKGPPTDPSQPPLTLPPLSAAEKAERTLLRALFTPDWRSYILANLHPDYLISPHSQALFQWVAKTPANAEGGVEPLQVLLGIEKAEAEAEIPDGAQVTTGKEGLISVLDSNSALSGKISAKLSDYLRDVVEDSTSVLSNEPLNEAAISGWIRRLHDHYQVQKIRQLTEYLERDDLTPEQRNACLQKQGELVRAQRGSVPGK